MVAVMGLKLVAIGSVLGLLASFAATKVLPRSSRTFRASILSPWPASSR
jgi:hypothetical protein